MISENKRVKIMYNCKYCLKECKSIQSLRGHKRLCKLNPNFEENYKKQIKRTSKGRKEYYKNKVDSNPLNQTKIYNLICSKCGKEYQLNLKIRLYNRGCYPKTCSSKCAHSRELSEESKKPKSENLKKEHIHTCPKCGKQFLHKGTSPNTECPECFLKRTNRYRGVEYEKRKKNNDINDIRRYICKLCGKEYTFNKKNNLTGSTRFFCSKEHFLEWRSNRKKYDPEYCKKMSESAKQLMAEGKIKPWQSRNIKSYAEKFFHKVLSLNNIQYESEVPESGYFLDFVIRTPKGSIDLEIDGK